MRLRSKPDTRIIRVVKVTLIDGSNQGTHFHHRLTDNLDLNDLFGGDPCETYQLELLEMTTA